jgi:hypothetical protein
VAARPARLGRFAWRITMSEDTKFGLIVLFTVFAIAVIGPALAG